MVIDTKELFNETMKDVTLERTEPEELHIHKRVEPEKTTHEEVEPEELYYDEEDLAEDHEDDFSYVIRQRGEDYYHGNHVLSVSKNGNNYIGKVGGNSNKPYEVSISVYGDDIEYECTCPCDFPCKHEYAVLLAISNLEYEEVELKPIVREKETNLKALIESIPAEEIKSYLLSPVGKDHVAIEMDAFNEYFRKYLPNQVYEYYYNNLYNNLVLDTDYDETVDNYLDRVKQYIAGSNFEESSKIIKAIITAYRDSNKINFDDYIIDVLPKIGMFLRVTYRKSDDKVREEIDNWIQELEKENYYDNFYLEDIIFGLKSGR